MSFNRVDAVPIFLQVVKCNILIILTIHHLLFPVRFTTLMQCNFMQLVYSLFTASHQRASDVGFSVYAEHGYQYPDPGETISFPLVMTNNGGHYDPSESVFTCPLSGTYYFTITLYTDSLSDGDSTIANIQKDGEELSEASCFYYGSPLLYTQCGNSAVVHCHLGQRVFVTTKYSGTQLYGLYKRCTFSGFLIHADEPTY